jgi:hypothetical protein
MRFQTLSPTLDHALAATPPRLLFHYTSSAGLIGILRTKELWATNVAFFNDAQEVERAVGLARLVIDNTKRNINNEQDSSALEAMRSYVGAAAKRYYVCSLTEERDLLSQWRAYCPPGDGYSIGFPSTQLSAVAEAQNFILSPCIYDPETQRQIVQEFVNSFLSMFRSSIASGFPVDECVKQIAWEFGQHVTQFGISLKHPAFHEEKEWRLISPSIEESGDNVDYRSSSFGVVPFYHFRLTDSQHPNLARAGDDHLTVVVGPTADPFASQMAVQFLLTSTLGIGNAFHSLSEIPFRDR